ncbi:MAG TPA: hypothetical protein VN764_15795, partial [Polyangiaceae bacterium]|nr:hypothetical protein [Polyangiaceae bacterium]
AVEGLLVVTFLVMVWIGLDYLGKAYVVAQKTRMVARGCAFYLASNNCSSVPSFCQVTTATSTTDSSASADQLTQVADQGNDSKYADATSAEVNSEVDNGLFQRAETTAQAELERPGMFGGGTTNLDQTFSLPCNPKPGTLMDKAMDLFAQLFHLAKTEVEE